MDYFNTPVIIFYSNRTFNKHKQNAKAGGSKAKEGELVAIENTGDTSGALRKNKAFQQLRREMEHKNRMRRKAAAAAAAAADSDDEAAPEPAEELFVDRHRAAAVAYGNKDIKNDLKVKR